MKDTQGKPIKEVALKLITSPDSSDDLLIEKTIKTDKNGKYQVKVHTGWHGYLEPNLAGYKFQSSSGEENQAEVQAMSFGEINGNPSPIYIDFTAKKINSQSQTQLLNSETPTQFVFQSEGKNTVSITSLEENVSLEGEVTVTEMKDEKILNVVTNVYDVDTSGLNFNRATRSINANEGRLRIEIPREDSSKVFLLHSDNSLDSEAVEDQKELEGQEGESQENEVQETQWKEASQNPKVSNIVLHQDKVSFETTSHNSRWALVSKDIEMDLKNRYFTFALEKGESTSTFNAETSTDFKIDTVAPTNVNVSPPTFLNNPWTNPEILDRLGTMGPSNIYPGNARQSTESGQSVNLDTERDEENNKEDAEKQGFVSDQERVETQGFASDQEDVGVQDFVPSEEEEEGVESLLSKKRKKKSKKAIDSL